MGTALHSRIRRVTSTPSMSGSPRSSRTASGPRVEASRSAASPVSASISRYPWWGRDARRKRRTWGSSSTTSTSGVWPGSGAPVIVLGLAAGGWRAHDGQGEAERGTVGRTVLGPDVPAVSLDDGAYDGQPE